MSAFRALTSELSSALHSFIQSGAPFRVVRTIKSPSASGAVSAQPSPQTVVILDSSFNPPSRAHHSILSSALAPGPVAKHVPPCRVLLLFSTHNADKAASAASFERRLALMTLFAEDLHAALPSLYVDIDIGLTTKPYYTDKSTAISSSGTEGYTETARHVHLIGYDTLTRFFAAKYYGSFDPPLSALEPYFDAGHRLWAALRPGDGYGSVEDQRSFIEGIGKGELESDGGKREWAEQIDTVSLTDGAGISSTRIRKAAKEQDWSDVHELCTKRVAQAVEEENLYAESA